MEEIECVNESCPTATAIYRITFYVHGPPNLPQHVYDMVEESLEGRATFACLNTDEGHRLPVDVQEVDTDGESKGMVDFDCEHSTRGQWGPVVDCHHPDAIEYNGGFCDTSNCPKDGES